jgi:hypothetical protein
MATEAVHIQFDLFAQQLFDFPILKNDNRDQIYNARLDLGCETARATRGWNSFAKGRVLNATVSTEDLSQLL